MIVRLLTEHYLEFLSLKGGCTGSSQSTHVKSPHCWKSHVAAHLLSPLSSAYVITNSMYPGQTAPLGLGVHSVCISD